ncbi:YihY/virulence factor BrkB family protein [Thalassotalea sp. 1_MG-2023]|uniref:YihY/virulence factor BrkB family protein n=1 Tax=Thalassotalea sp. 1_MG-2023 TaxID=3062680 RepID=UPI0026E3D74F|nr:YihY/virulence factor BrkB family protein [Thalassotalea sp. 1_MG-2023]MDO6427699.1 YihY/virulence factor BrkB family protein [Thalassotalea sp. 1_MG-2023]
MTSEHSVTHPQSFSVKSWWYITKRVFRKVQRDNMPLIAAGVAFYFLLAVFPLLAALVSMYGLFVDQVTLSQHINMLVGVIPEQSRSILEGHVERLVTTDDRTLNLSFLISFILALWSGGKGSVALITACNITYQENKSRSFFKKIIARVLLTLATVLIMLLMLVLLVGIPLVFSDVNESIQKILTLMTWPLLLTIFYLSLANLYKYAPHRASAKWRWVTPGALMATLLWLAGSYLFNLYITKFAGYNETYGSMGGVIILLMWFYVTTYTILLGAEINAAAELQTLKDTTTGEDKPRGERGAYVANNGPEDNNLSDK